MSKKICITCLKCTLVLSSLLFLQLSQAQNKFGHVEEWLNNNLEQIGGRAVLMIYKDGNIVFSKAQNRMNIRQRLIGRFVAKKQGRNVEDVNRDYSTASKIPIASSSKWLSAALLMTFVDEGKLSLDDSVGKFLPVMSANRKGNILIWQCLTHLTGVSAPKLKESIEEMKNVHSMDEAIKKIAMRPMEGEPGKTFHYSSIGLQIAGAIMEKISGKDFETLFAERIAKPCEMTNTDFGKKEVALPAGSAYSTAEDYIRFLEMLLHNGTFNNRTVLSQSSVAKMQHNYARKATIAYSPAEVLKWGYGFGEWITEDADERARAIASPGLFGCFPWIDNAKNYAAVLFCFNLKNKGRNELYTELKTLVDEAIDR